MSRKRPGCLVNLILIGGLMGLLAVAGGLVYYLLKEDAVIPPVPPVAGTPPKLPAAATEPPIKPVIPAPPKSDPVPVVPPVVPPPVVNVPATPTPPPPTPPPAVQVKTSAPESKPETIQDKATFDAFQAEVTQRIEEADDDKFDSEMKDTARSVVRKLSGLIKVMTVRFESGSTLSAENQALLEAALTNPGVKASLADPEAGFIVLGFADSSGSPADNKRLSKERADAVRQFLKDGAGITHKTYSFGLGISTTLSSDPKKNRAAEIWLAIPGEKP